MVLPERTPLAGEEQLLAALSALRASDARALDTLADEVLYTTPSGDVVVGKSKVAAYFAQHAATRAQCGVAERLLQTPDSLPAGTLVIDQAANGIHTLVVVKRRAADGRVASITEEEGHRKPTVPSTARTGASNAFHSPTDNMLSPCTSKLNVHKRRHHLKGKPTALFAGMGGGVSGH